MIWALVGIITWLVAYSFAITAVALTTRRWWQSSERELDVLRRRRIAARDRAWDAEARVALLTAQVERLRAKNSSLRSQRRVMTLERNSTLQGLLSTLEVGAAEYSAQAHAIQRIRDFAHTHMKMENTTYTDAEVVAHVHHIAKEYAS
jgi:hypothetical protein